MKAFIFLLLLVLSMPFTAFSQKFQNIKQETQYKGKVKSVTRYEYRIHKFDSTEVNPILNKTGRAKHFAEYSATGQIQNSKSIHAHCISPHIFEYDEFDNVLKKTSSPQCFSFPTVILQYDYDYKNKSVVIFKNDKKYKFRQYDAKNRIILEKKFFLSPKQSDNNKECSKEELTYNSDGSTTRTSYYKGKVQTKHTTSFDSLTQVKTEISQSASGYVYSNNITKIEGDEVVEKHTIMPYSIQFIYFKDARGNTIKRYRYSQSFNSAYVYEYEIDYY